METLENFKMMPRGLTVGEMCDLTDYLPARTHQNLHEAGIPLWAAVSLAHQIAISRNIPADSLKDALCGCPALENELDRITAETIQQAESLEAWARETCEDGGLIPADMPTWLKGAIDFRKVAESLKEDHIIIGETEAIRQVWERRPGIDKEKGAMRLFIFANY